jgi:hypothetical protein
MDMSEYQQEGVICEARMLHSMTDALCLSKCTKCLPTQKVQASLSIIFSVLQYVGCMKPFSGMSLHIILFISEDLIVVVNKWDLERAFP